MSAGCRRRRRADGPGRGDRPGGRLPALRVPAGRRARAGRLRAQRRPRGAARGRGRRRRGRGVPGPAGPEAPPLAVLERVGVSERRRRSARPRFAIRASPRGQRADAPVTPDSATCADCLRELFDPGDRRYRYPFINCTNCGPRFTIVRGDPLRPAAHDDGRLSRCARPAGPSTRIPADRRFHAQPNACPECGPSAAAARRRGGAASTRRTRCGRPRPRCATGAILAVKGIGGFHLACRADDEAAVARLRARKHREDKPFALMVGLARGRRARWSGSASAERTLLSGAGAPDRARAAPSPAPPVARLGRPGRAGARRDAPLLAASPSAARRLRLAAGDDQRQRLRRADRLRGRGRARSGWRAIADLLPGPRPADRDPHRRLGASGWWRGGRPLFLRRSRGYVPAALPLPGRPARPLLACGAELKNTFCLAKATRAWVCHHIGDLQNYETLRSFTDGIEHFERLFAVDARGRRPRPAPRVPVDQVRARARRGRAGRRPAPPRPPGRLPGRARRARPGRGRDLRRHRLRAPTARCGAASCWSATSSGFRRAGSLLAGARCPAASGRSASRGGWPARGCAAGHPPELPRRSRRIGRPPAPGRRSRGWPRPGSPRR